jgi:ferredoxin
MVQLRYLSNVVTLTQDAEKCNGCRTCAEVCPHGVFVVEKRRSRIVDRDACMECGACAQNCKRGALSVQAGVGCAAAVLSGMMRGTAPTCGSSADSTCCG